MSSDCVNKKFSFVGIVSAGNCVVFSDSDDGMLLVLMKASRGTVPSDIEMEDSGGDVVSSKV
jgi:hypothetical protein